MESGKKYAEKKFCDEFGFVSGAEFAKLPMHKQFAYYDEVTNIMEHLKHTIEQSLTDQANRTIGQAVSKALLMSDRSNPSELSEHVKRAPVVSVIDQMAEIQKIINKNESDICDIMSTPAGARLLDWSYAVSGTWWYRLFSRIDVAFKKRIERVEPPL